MHSIRYLPNKIDIHVIPQTNGYQKKISTEISIEFVGIHRDILRHLLVSTEISIDRVWYPPRYPSTFFGIHRDIHRHCRYPSRYPSTCFRYPFTPLLYMYWHRVYMMGIWVTLDIWMGVLDIWMGIWISV